jgi:hypothetical protein
MTIFGIQILCWVKINFNSIVRWRGLVKINVYRVYNLQVFDDHIRFHETLLNKKNWKIMKCPSIKSPPLSYGNDLFF